MSQSAQGKALRPLADILAEPSNLPDGWDGWIVNQQDPESGLCAAVTISRSPGARVLRVHTRIRNEGTAPVHLTGVSIVSSTLLPESQFDEIDVLFGRSGWMAEGRWERRWLTDFLADIGTELHGESARDCFRLSSESGWSSSRWATTGFVEDRTSRKAIGWQVENNGGWTVELSRRDHALALAAYGPTDLQHHWLRVLNAGEEFVTPTIALAFGEDGWESALAQLVNYRRALRRATNSGRTVAPIVYNDYLNTVMADPTSEKLDALISAASAVGAEAFCIDAGWFADKQGPDWWTTVGEWLPSKTRFTDGLPAELDKIRRHGMIPGLWIEPLAVGLDSPNADELAPACMTRAGVTIVEQNRMRLDMRKPQARAHLDVVLDRMMSYGIGYLKIDDNFSIGSGPDGDADSPGDGLLEHGRAWAQWLTDLGLRYPDLVIENCGSGGMTSDYALLAGTDVQSTSDLQEMGKYPLIASAAPMSILPEQAGNWGVPQPGMDVEEVISTLTTSLAGSLYLGGHLNQLSQRTNDLVREAVVLAKAERQHRLVQRPHWPLGLPKWRDEWLALAYLPTETSNSDDGVLILWHRPAGTAKISSTTLFTSENHWRLGEQLFPSPDTEDLHWEIVTSAGEVRFEVPAASTTARIYRIHSINHQHGIDDAAPRE